MTVQEEVVQETESKQALLTEAAHNTDNEAQRQENVKCGWLCCACHCLGESGIQLYDAVLCPSRKRL